MYKIAITGAPGSGKSRTRKFFEKLGALTIDADDIARDLLKPGTPAFLQVLKEFGREILTTDNEINRRKLRNKIIQNNDDRIKIEKILQPIISFEIKQKLNDFSWNSIIAVEMAIMLDECVDYFDSIILVIADEATKIRRVMKRDSCTAEEAEALIALHPPDEERKKLADVIIDNS